MDLRRRNGPVMRHDLLFRKADIVFRKADIVFRKAFVSMESVQARSSIIWISCMRLSS